MPSQAVLLVCTANICRSPAAAALWQRDARLLGLRHRVTSCGLDARPGQPADAVFKEMLAAQGLNLDAHWSERFNASAAAEQELILVMEDRQARRLRSMVPTLSGRIHLLGRWGQGEIADPHGGPLPGYEQCLALMTQAVDQWLSRLR